MPYGLHDAQPERNKRKFAIVTNAKMTIKSPLKPPLGMTLEPSIGKKQMAKTIIVKAMIGAKVKTVFFSFSWRNFFFVKQFDEVGKGLKDSAWSCNHGSDAVLDAGFEFAFNPIAEQS